MKILLMELKNGEPEEVGAISVSSGSFDFSGRAEEWLDSIKSDFPDAPSPQEDFSAFAKWADSTFNGVGFFVDIVEEDEKPSVQKNTHFLQAKTDFQKGVSLNNIAITYGVNVAMEILKES